MTFGEKLKKFREEKELTQAQLGKLIGVSDRVIGYYESDDRFPKDEEILRKLADYFNVTLDYLLGRTDNPNEKKYKHLDDTLIGRVSTKMEKMSEDELELLDKLVDKLMKDNK